MGISRMRSGHFAGPFFIVAMLMVAGPGAAQAACKDLVETFDKAIADRQVDAAVSALKNVGGDPSPLCVGRLAEFRARLGDFLLEHSRTPDLAAAEHDKAIATARLILEASGHWKGQAQLADYYFTHGDRLLASAWYRLSASTLATPGAAAATDMERRELLTRLAAAASLTRDDKSRPVISCSRCIISFPEVLARLWGTGVVIPAPVRIRFDGTHTGNTPSDMQALQELAEIANEVQAVTLIGHVAARGRTHEENMELSERRVTAVRDALVKSGVRARIAIKWKGDLEPFDVSALPDAGKLSQDDVSQLDDRIEWVR
jgi:outer membrane protein OmpA-like peptidoglycan-associated protein